MYGTAGLMSPYVKTSMNCAGLDNQYFSLIKQRKAKTLLCIVNENSYFFIFQGESRKHMRGEMQI